ncbi:glycine--tRNA ligase [Candidatus Dojkabacteria bacterium]|nr:glycine--tRNA ligase [Candidatus Dojkabacteria bacterium]
MIEGNDLKCPKCGNRDWTKSRKFSSLFETSVGIIVDDKSKVYLRGEIAQGLFLSYKNILDSIRVKLPFGIAQQGKAFRNEITKGQFTYRTLEFDLMEFEFFVREAEWEKWYNHWKGQTMDWFESLGIDNENLRWRTHTEDELSHYSDRTEDVEYYFSFGWNEVGAVAYRTDFDLKNHMKHTDVDLSYRDQSTGEKFIPHVIEPTFGHSRIMTMLFNEAYTEEKLDNGKTRVVLKFDKKIAPVKIAVFPLQKDDKLKARAREIYEKLKEDYVCEFDDAGNIGKMYRRQDEIGTPYCVTVDFDSLEDESVTVRDRDTMEQERVKIPELKNYFGEKFSA